MASTSINRPTDKQNAVHLDNGVLFKRKEILLFVTVWMNLEGMTWRETRQSQKDQDCLIPPSRDPHNQARGSGAEWWWPGLGEGKWRAAVRWVGSVCYPRGVSSRARLGPGACS